MQESDAVALELEELRKEQAGYEQQIQAVDEAMKAIQEQIDSMACTVSQNKVWKENTHRTSSGMINMLSCGNIIFSPLHIFCLAVQEAVRNAQEELSKQKEVIMVQDKELKVKILFFSLTQGFLDCVSFNELTVFIHLNGLGEEHRSQQGKGAEQRSPAED